MLLGIRQRHFRLVSSLINCRQLRSINTSSTKDDTLHTFAVSGDLDALSSKINQGTEVNAKDARGWTALMLAARYGHSHIADLLLKHGSDQALHNMTGQTALEIAQFWQRKDIYDMLNSTTASSSNSSISSGIDRCSELRSNSSWMLQTIKREDSVFVALHDGHPVVTQDDKTLSYQLLRMNYCQVQPYIHDNEVVFLGLHQEYLNGTVKKFRISENEQSQLITNTDIKTQGTHAIANKKTISELIDEKMIQKVSGKHTDSESNRSISSEVNSAVQTPAYFCIDLTDLPVTELKVLSDRATVLTSFRFIGLKGRDHAIVKQARPLLDWHRRHSFCATCSSPTTLSEGGYKRICQNQQCLSRTGAYNTSYPRLDPTVICAVISADRQNCLLARKLSFPLGMFSCVAGFVEPGENLEQACVREVEEETGVHIGSVRYHSSQFWPMPSVLMLGFLAYATDVPQTIQVDTSELETARWFDRRQVVDMLTLQHPDTLFVPPRQAIAHRLIKAWVLETAFQ